MYVWEMVGWGDAVLRELKGGCIGVMYAVQGRVHAWADFLGT